MMLQGFGLAVVKQCSLFSQWPGQRVVSKSELSDLLIIRRTWGSPKTQRSSFLGPQPLRPQTSYPISPSLHLHLSNWNYAAYLPGWSRGEKKGSMEHTWTRAPGWQPSSLLGALIGLSRPSSWGWQRRVYKALLVAQESEPSADGALALLGAAAFSVADIRLTASQVHYIESSLPCGAIIPR